MNSLWNDLDWCEKCSKSNLFQQLWTKNLEVVCTELSREIQTQRNAAYNDLLSQPPQTLGADPTRSINYRHANTSLFKNHHQQLPSLCRAPRWRLPVWGAMAGLRVFRGKQSSWDILKTWDSKAELTWWIPERCFHQKAPLQHRDSDNEPSRVDSRALCSTGSGDNEALNHLMTKAKRHHPIEPCASPLIWATAQEPFTGRCAIKVLLNQSAGT